MTFSAHVSKVEVADPDILNILHFHQLIARIAFYKMYAGFKHWQLDAIGL